MPRGTGNRAALAVAELSRLFTKDRSSLTSAYLDDPAHAGAYLQYFLPVNLSKIQVLLEEMPEDWPEHGQGDPIRVLDVGSGPGTGALAVLDWFQQHRPDRVNALSVVAVDASRNALNQARNLWDTYSRESGAADASLTTFEGNLERSVKGSLLDRMQQRAPYDLIVMANCLNELFAQSADPVAARVDLVTILLSVLAPHGSFMIVEPALRDTSRALHQVRDRLVQEKCCTIYSPCLHEQSCPALVNPFDWCHEERAWEPPPVIQEIDEEVGFIKDALKFSYLLLRKDGRTIVGRRPDVYRVVSELREMKGEKRAWLCNESGRSEIGRQDRLASPQNAAVDEWHRGAIVQIERVVRKEREGKVSAVGRIERDAVVEVLRPA
ncbi:small ribosomal subunit Rsm22 family protein [Nitrospira sp. NS4]|uniref:small ribosomal subunit Rsm22 family protein n=1 Tax=Nitrospira sp. NS4 TaxID=3414498 RepID=UPI003C2C46F7